MTTTNNLHPDLSAGVHELRGAFTDLFGAVGIDVRRPQDLARKLSLDKSLAWKLSRIVCAGDPQNALQHMPGDAALTIIMRAVNNAGGNEGLRRRAEGAVKNFQAAVLRHVGDRPTLELIVDGMPADDGQRLSVSRKLAYRGNSGIWGVQAKARLQTCIIAPNRDRPEMMDCAHASGWIDFRRIRGDARWVVFRRSTQIDSDGVTTREEPMDASGGSNVSGRIMTEFCSHGLPEIHTAVQGGLEMHELGPTNVGNSGTFTLFLGSMNWAIGPQMASNVDDIAQFRASISAPVEMLQFDMLVHRDCEFALQQKISTFGGFAPAASPLFDRDLLPINATRSDLGREPPAVQTPLFSRYVDLTERMFARMGRDRREFVGVRYAIEYPAFPSTVEISFPLKTP